MPDYKTCKALEGSGVLSELRQDEAGCSGYKHYLSDIVDLVNAPSHYTKGEIECIDAMKACTSDEAYRGHLKLTVIKYLWRYESKANPLEDLKKAQWYLTRLIKEVEDGSNTN